MSEESDELVSSYQRIRKQLDQQSAENKILTEKVNSLVVMLQAEKEEKLALERQGIVEKINSINPDFKPTDDMDANALKWILKGMENAPKTNSTKKKDDSDEPINPQPDTPKINGKPIPDELKQFIAKKEDTTRVFEVLGGSTE